MISLCMIVKDEEEIIEKSLKEVKNYVDEIIIVDTGSKDRTKEIAKSYTEKIYDFKWCNDFSKARNYSISLATYDWILVLDADEVVSRFNREEVDKFILNNDKKVGRIKIINFFEDNNEKRINNERVNRLFNRKYYNYEGIIHEQIVSKNKDSYDTMLIDIEVDHIGYLDHVIKSTNKLDRNITLLYKALEDNPLDDYLYYQLGKSFYKKKNYNEAYNNFRQALEMCDDFRLEYVEDLIESFGYTLINCQKYSEALSLKEYGDIYGNIPDYNFVMGLIFMNNGRFEEAINSFISCLVDDEGKIEGVTSYLPNYNIGVIYECLGFKDEAFKYYKACGSYELALNRINNFR